MKSSKPSIVIITNLYPLPWEPNRATFNRQQFELLKDDYDTNFLIPIAFPEWFRHREQIRQTENIRYVPYFYLPKFGRRLYSFMMFLSIIIHSGFWLYRKHSNIMLASWAFPEAVATSWLSKIYRSKFYFKVHGSDINFHGKFRARAKQIVSAANSAENILSVSQALANEMNQMGISSNKIKVIYNGVNHDKFGKDSLSPVNEDYLLFVGNLKRDKGVIELIQSFNDISCEYPQLKLYYVGSGEMMETISKYIKSKDLEDKVSLLGTLPHDKLPMWISHARALCLPSYNEGVPNVVLEAMSAGTPVLATSVGGIPEVVNEEVCGVIIPPKSTKALVRGISKVLNTPWSREEIKQHAKQFSWEKNKEQLLKMLKDNNI